METNKKVWIRGVLGRGNEVINELVKLGGNNHGLCGEILNDIYYIGPDNSIEYIRDDIKRAKEIMAEYKEIKLDDSPSITASQDYGLKVSKDLSTFAKTCINLPEGSSVNICNENGKVMIIVEPKQVKEEEPQFKKGDIIYIEGIHDYHDLAIVESIEENYILVSGYIDLNANKTYICLNNDYDFYSKRNIKYARLATKEEIEKFNKEFAEQKHLKWNAKEFKFEEYRWKAEKGEKFWFINSLGEVKSSIVYGDSSYEEDMYNSRNYFKSEELANKALPLWKEFFKNLRV